MSDPLPVRFGILGAGRVASNAFVPALRLSERATLVAAASRDPGRALRLAPARAYDCYEKLLDDPDVEAVYIATHNGLHRPLALQALERGKHVLCEKPLAINAAECEEVVSAAKESGQLLVEAFMYRHHPQIKKAKELVETGAIGELKAIEASFSFHLTKQDDVRLNKDWGGGALLDVGCYCVNFSRAFLGNRPESVQAVATFHPEHGVDMSLHGTLGYGAGRYALVSCGFDAGLRNRALLCGTGGTISLPRVFVSWVHPPTVRLENDDGVQTFEFEKVNVYQSEIDDFSRAIRDGGEALLGPDEGLHNARLIDALQRASLGPSGLG